MTKNDLIPGELYKFIVPVMGTIQKNEPFLLIEYEINGNFINAKVLYEDRITGARLINREFITGLQKIS